jgi:hypothetical protein
MRPGQNRHWKTRAWRAAPQPDRSLLTNARRRTVRRPEARFSPLPTRLPEPERSPLAKIPTLAHWLAERDRLLRDMWRSRALKAS